ncbi:hypothetical protein SDC9_185922 [bioreactor metagenome]|uniref:Uncharacterized protein n=1 Tax=bioreactor metagenome TaxID=1076179 RepID=A0A645HH92_9ZZZZ
MGAGVGGKLEQRLPIAVPGQISGGLEHGLRSAGIDRHVFADGVRQVENHSITSFSRK